MAYLLNALLNYDYESYECNGYGSKLVTAFFGVASPLILTYVPKIWRENLQESLRFETSPSRKKRCFSKWDKIGVSQNHGFPDLPYPTRHI